MTKIIILIHKTRIFAREEKIYQSSDRFFKHYQLLKNKNWNQFFENAKKAAWTNFKKKSLVESEKRNDCDDGEAVGSTFDCFVCKETFWVKRMQQQQLQLLLLVQQLSGVSLRVLLRG